MAQRVNGVLGMIERMVRDCETARLEDVGEWAKIFARLERVAETLVDEEHVAAELAQKLCAVTERIVDGKRSLDKAVMKQGLLALQSHVDDNEPTIDLDQSILIQLQEFIDGLDDSDELVDEEMAQTDEDDEEMQDEVVVKEEDVINMDGIDWKSLPDVDLDALEEKVAKEKSDVTPEQEDVHHVMDEGESVEDLLAEETQAIRTQLSEVGYVVFDQEVDDMQDELKEETGETEAETSDEAQTVLDLEDAENVADVDMVLDERDAEGGELVVTESVNEKNLDVLDDNEAYGEGEVADEEEHVDVKEEEVVLELETESSASDVTEDDDVLDVMAGAVTVFLDDDMPEGVLNDAIDTARSIEPSEQTVETEEANMEEDTSEDTFWTDAEPILEPDVEVSQIAEKVEPVDASEENSALAQIALDTVTLDLDDMSGLGRVHTQLETLVSEFEDRPLSAQLAQALGVVIEKIILLECDAEDPLSLICEGIAMLQSMDLEVRRGSAEKFTNATLIKKIMQVAEINLDSIGNSSDEEMETPESDDGDLSGPIDVDQDIFFDFASEAEEHLETAESKLLELESQSEDKEVINAVFRSFHTIKGASGFLNLEDVTRVAHCVEDVLDSARKGTLTLTPSILDVALESLDLLAQLIGKTKSALEKGQPVYAQDVTAFVGKMEQAAAGDVVEIKEEMATESVASSDEDVATKAQKPEAAPKSVDVQPERRGQNREQSYVRVGTEKLDQLVNLVGELVIAQTQVSQNPDVVHTANQKLTKDISQLMKISTDIQEISMSMRMVPIRSTFERMARIIRDLSRKCGKQVRFEMSGEDTELDKNVVEELVDPLTHMVRNAVDHGIESEEDRLTAGKTNQGSVHLNAYHKGGNIVIELRDDGKGLDRDKIMEKAVERGLVQPDAQLSDEEVFAMIFQAGFSTAEQISDISGRGVGMDVVRRNIEGLRGRVDVTSELGKGSVFTIRLPLTLAIIDGMVIGVGEERYILPMTAIVRSLRPEKDDVFYVMGKGEMIRVQEELLPIVRLYNRFGVPPTCQEISESLVVIVEAEGKRCGVMVDELLGMQQVVIKGLHDHLRKEPCLSGCAILGDGRVGLILDANGLVRQGNKSDTKRDGNGVAYRSAS